MPELPDVVVYLESLERLVLGEELRTVDVRGISLLRSYDPPISAVEGQPVIGLRRLGKRLVFAFPDELFMVLHLMIAGRLQWKKVGAPVPGKVGLAAFQKNSATATRITRMAIAVPTRLKESNGDASGASGRSLSGVEAIEANCTPCVTALGKTRLRNAYWWSTRSTAGRIES